LTLNLFNGANPQRDSRNAAILHKWASLNPEPLGLSPGETFRVFSFHPLHRVGPDGQVCFDYVVELLQEREEAIDPNDPESEKFPFYGGSTLILDNMGKVRYAVIKRIGNERRLARQRAFLQGETPASAASAFVRRAADGLSFAAVHRGY
jgi:hypothetical protein